MRNVVGLFHSEPTAVAQDVVGIRDVVATGVENKGGFGVVADHVVPNDVLHGLDGNGLEKMLYSTMHRRATVDHLLSLLRAAPGSAPPLDNSKLLYEITFCWEPAFIFDPVLTVPDRDKTASA